MKKTRKFMMVSVLVLGVLFFSAYATYAFGGPGWGGGGGHKLLRMIGLTDAQKQAIKTALENDPTLLGLKSTLKADIPALIAARKALKLDMLKYLAGTTPKITIPEIKNDQANVATAEAAVAPLRAKIRLQVLEDIQAALTGPNALTAPQLARLDKIIAALE